jgi:putative transposase
MPCGLRRFQESGQSHFVTFSCYRRQPYFEATNVFDLFVHCLEDMRRRFELCVYGYVVMPEHVHLLSSEPPHAKLAEAIHYLKLSFAKRLRSGRSGDNGGTFWQKRYYDRNIRNYREFVVKLRYLHRNPVKRGLIVNPRSGSGVAIGTTRYGRLG